MDIHSEKGQVSRLHEQTVIKRILNAFPGVEIIETDKDLPAKIDILICRENELKAVGEIKCRNLSYEKIKYGLPEWMITYQKIIDGAKLAKELCCDFYGFLYLIPEDKIHYFKIADSNGNFLFNFDVREFETNASVNGGRALRKNAILDLKHSKVI